MRLFCFFFIFFTYAAFASIQVGVGHADITPAVSTPSAGYAARKSEPMIGVHDPLTAHALSIVTPSKKIVLCSVDNLGFTYDMVHQIQKSFPEYELYLSSSHTHSGGGCFLNIPGLDVIAGPYDAKITNLYIEKTKDAIHKAIQAQVRAKIGIGYGISDKISTYRASWPVNIEPLRQICVIKVTAPDDTPIAVVFNYAIHPTILPAENRLFSADFVGYTRKKLQSELGCLALFINGAQGDINPAKQSDTFDECNRIGTSLAQTVIDICSEIETFEDLKVCTKKITYEFTPKPTPFGLVLPISTYKSEMNLLVFNDKHAFLTIPGELSCLYETQFKNLGKHFGFDHVSIFGLTNDAHGYIILPDAFRHKTQESGLSFGGENYGEEIKARALTLFKD